MYSRHGAVRISCSFLYLGLLFVVPVGSLSAAATESSALADAFRSEDLLWEIQLGTHQYTNVSRAVVFTRGGASQWAGHDPLRRRRRRSVCL